MLHEFCKYVDESTSVVNCEDLSDLTEFGLVLLSYSDLLRNRGIITNM